LKAALLPPPGPPSKLPLVQTNKTDPIQITAFAPATLGNLSLGFDILGLALSGRGDRVTARKTEKPGVLIREIEGLVPDLPREPERNTAGIAAQRVLKLAGATTGIELSINKGLPLACGLGGSAASAVAAAVATNALIGEPLKKEDLLPACIAAEAAVSGRHADNVAPALLGGLVLVRAIDPPDVLQLPLPAGLGVALVTPTLSLATHHARDALPKQVSLEALVHTTANLSALVSALYSGDLDLIGRLEPDRVVTPVRAGLIPGCQAAMDAARQSGALMSSISGSGPSVFALCRSETEALAVAQVMGEAFEGAGVENETWVSPAACGGAGVVR
jgi:homoserine kinase